METSNASQAAPCTAEVCCKVAEPLPTAPQEPDPGEKRILQTERRRCILKWISLFHKNVTSIILTANRKLVRGPVNPIPMTCFLGPQDGTLSPTLPCFCQPWTPASSVLVLSQNGFLTSHGD